MQDAEQINSKPNPQSKHALFSIFLTIFIDMLGVGVLIPVFPLLVLPSSPFRVIPANWSIDQGFILLGWLSASFPIALFLCAPILGQLADRFGRKKILAISVSGTAISYLLFAIGIEIHSIPLLFFSRLLDGATGGNISVAQAIISDISSPQNRAKNFGLIGLSFGLGFIFGPFLGGRLSDSNTITWFTAATPFYFTTILSIINICLIMRFLPETLKVKNNRRLDITRPLHNLVLALSTPGLRNILPSTFLFNMGFTFFTTFFAVTLAHKFNFNQGHIGDYFAYVGIMIALAQGVVVRKIAKFTKDYQILRVSMFISAISLFIIFLIPENHGNYLYFIPPFLAIGNALTMAFSAALVARVTPDNMHGEAMGISSSVAAIAQAIPAIISGYVAAIDPSLPTIVGAGIVFFGGILFWLIFKPKQFPQA